MKKEWFIIVNPTSGSGNGRKLWEGEVIHKLKQAKIQFHQYFTEHSTHATELTKEAIDQGFRKIMAVGGDGTYNEVVNGILRQEIVPSTDITFSVIPNGTGNDWVKTMRIPKNTDEAIQLIHENNPYLHDVGLATYYDGAEEKQRYFANVGGSGLDAYVAQQMNNSKQFGKLSYLVGLVKGLIGYKNADIEVASEDGNIKEKALIVTVAICQYFGNGMKIAPNAVPNDGLFDITFIKDMSKIGVVKQLKNLYNGSFINHPKVETFRTKLISIKSKQNIYLQLDGELLGHGPFKFEIVPKALKILADMKA